MLFKKLYWNHKLHKWHRKKIAKLKGSEAVLLRYPKSGVTWLRVMISHIYQQRSGNRIAHLIGSNEFAEAMPQAPRLLIANENMGVDNETVKKMISGRKVILLVRDPRDIAVSLYFHFSKRATKLEHLSYGIPENVREMSLYAFLMNAEFGLRNVIDYLNFWSRSLRGSPNALVIRYEDLRRAPADGLRQVMHILSPGTTEAEIEEAVSFSDFEKMKEREAQGATDVSILAASDESDSDSYKVRRGKVGGYVDYLSPEEKDRVDQMVRERLDPALAYSEASYSRAAEQVLKLSNHPHREGPREVRRVVEHGPSLRYCAALAFSTDERI